MLYGIGDQMLAMKICDPYFRAIIETTGIAACEASEKSVAYRIRFTRTAGKLGVEIARAFIAITQRFIVGLRDSRFCDQTHD